jgi:hypothetical protein
MIDLTPEDIARHYSAALDSVNLINEYVAQKPENMDLIEAIDTVKRNVDHLKIMIEKGYWSGDKLAVLQDAVNKGEYEPINEGKK